MSTAESDGATTNTTVKMAGLAIDAPASSAQSVTPFDVKGEMGADGVLKSIDYNALVDQFGTQRITKEDLQRFEKLTGRKPHRFLRRGIVFSHRDLNSVMDRYERGEPFFLYTGRGPSSDSMHIGHTVPFEFTKFLQDAFDVPLVIMMTDDEKYLFSEQREIEDVQGYTEKNLKDIIAVGFDPKKTFIFSDYEYMGGEFYKNVTRISKKLSFHDITKIFGFGTEANIGKVHFAAIQGAAAFASSFPHIFGDVKKAHAIPALIPCAIDQDPYFRATRDVAARLHFAKPCLIHASFLPALQGPGSKMSASKDTSAIFMTDEANKIKTKINKYAFSGGQADLEEHRLKGGDTEKDVSYQYLRFLLEDDEELERIRVEYSSGRMPTGEIKQKIITVLQDYVKGFQERRAAVTPELVEDFLARKALTFKANPNAIKVAQIGEEKREDAAGASSETSKNASKKAAKLEEIARKKKEKEAAKAAKAAGSVVVS